MFIGSSNIGAARSPTSLGELRTEIDIESQTDSALVRSQQLLDEMLRSSRLCHFGHSAAVVPTTPACSISDLVLVGSGSRFHL